LLQSSILLDIVNYYAGNYGHGVTTKNAAP
jgi:hypothetical protein